MLVRFERGVNVPRRLQKQCRDRQAQSVRPREPSQRRSELATDCTHDALIALVDIAKNSLSDAVRGPGANVLIDLAYEKPTVKEEIELIDLPPMMIQMI